MTFSKSTNMPPAEMWILHTTSKTRYYRTKMLLDRYIDGEIRGTLAKPDISDRIKNAELWYIDFRVERPGWILIDPADWQRTGWQEEDQPAMERSPMMVRDIEF